MTKTEMKKILPTCVVRVPQEQGWITAHEWTESHQQRGCCCGMQRHYGNGLPTSSDML